MIFIKFKTRNKTYYKIEKPWFHRKQENGCRFMFIDIMIIDHVYVNLVQQ